MKFLTFLLLLSTLNVSFAQDNNYQDMDNQGQTQEIIRPDEEYAGQEELELEKDQQSRYNTQEDEPEQPMEQESAEY